MHSKFDSYYYRMHLLISFTLILLFDAPATNNWYFQDPATQLAEQLILFHDQIMFYLIVTMVGVFFSMVRMIIKKRLISHKHIQHGTTLEIIWTLIPALILVTIAIPSFQLLYLIDEIIDPSITVRAIGLQWYWSYEYADYSDIEPISFDSYLIPEEDLEMGQIRLLTVDNNLVLPTLTHIRLLTTANDVFHCFAVPSLGVRIDAVPSQLNSTSFVIKREGKYYGICAELCGPAHYAMPIVVETLSISGYCTWILSQED